MPSNSEALVWAAGGGKTTEIVRRALATKERAALVTFTNNNTDEIINKLYEQNRFVPENVEVRSWLSFLLREMARPYRNSLYDKRIDGMVLVSGRSDMYSRAADIGRHYFGNGNIIYSDKVAKFVCECNKATGGAVIRRLERRFNRIYIDEMQDLAGYDFDVLELIMNSAVKLTLVGDHRQSTFKTNNSARHAGASGLQFIEKLKEWEARKLCGLSYQTESHRCNQEILDLSDAFFPLEPKTVSRNDTDTGHDGVFTVSPKMVDRYIKEYGPQVLRLDRRTSCGDYDARNMGDSKGLTFARVLIFPHKLGVKWLSTGNFAHVMGSRPKLYVGITRARYSVAFVFEGDCKIDGVKSAY